MADITEIAWTDSTFNPVIGCSKVSAGCDHCYAETMSNRYGWVEWGPHGERRVTSDANWRKPLRWNEQAEITNAPHRVFCASLSDVFDNKWPEGVRERLFNLIRLTPNLTWQLLTKRPQNVAKMLPLDWGHGYENVWLGTTTEDQTEYDRRWAVLKDVPAASRFVSYEPAIGPVSIAGFEVKPDWVIVGGESGPGARTMNPAWARDIIAECRQHGAAPFHKQWGTYRSNPLCYEQGMTQSQAKRLDSHGKGGFLIDGEPVQEFPDERQTARQRSLF